MSETSSVMSPTSAFSTRLTEFFKKDPNENVFNEDYAIHARSAATNT